ncbi:MAG TPA: class I SAM-dependent methyltransferase [Rhodanobacteraceae bacterium]|nr:class I SAM-dependent methyltransferase [Rhodanobacteraceae bacterium]
MSDGRATAEDIRYAYRLLLGREPDEGGFQEFKKLVDDQALTPLDLAVRVMDSLEFASKHPSFSRGVSGSGLPELVATRQICRACTQAQLESPEFQTWARRLGERPGHLHRKIWEWCFIIQVLQERGMLRSGRKGLGFAVGTEPLASLFASFGCEILASDIGEDLAQQAGWVDTNQHASGLSQLNLRGLCEGEQFDRQVKFREVDMRQIPEQLGDFDFLWSSCALEHLGSLDRGIEFVENAMRCLRPGGIAVHTTEINCDSDEETLETGHSVIYRRHDLTRLARELQRNGHDVEPLDFSLGVGPADRVVDEPPYTGETHLKLRIGKFASTSFGLIVRAGGPTSSSQTDEQ